jgi:hypothetical protein
VVLVVLVVPVVGAVAVVAVVGAVGVLGWVETVLRYGLRRCWWWYVQSTKCGFFDTWNVLHGERKQKPFF